MLQNVVQGHYLKLGIGHKQRVDGKKFVSTTPCTSSHVVRYII